MARKIHRPTNDVALKKATKETFRTPDLFWKAFLEQYPWLIKEGVLDPSAGDGRLFKWIKKHKDHIAIDIRKKELKNWEKYNLAKKVRRREITDFLQTNPKDYPKVGSVITNPPFSLAESFVKHSLQFIKPKGYVVVLQRLGWIGTIKRSQWLQSSCLKYKVIITKRPIWEIDGVTKNSSDTVDYAFYIFKEGYTGDPKIRWLFFKED